WPLAVVLLAGSVLILPRLGVQSLWVDEGLTVLAAVDSGSPRELVARVSALDSQPPASHLLLFASRDVLPRDEFAWRLPSFVAGEAAIVLLFLAAVRWYGSTVALLAAAAAQISPFFAFYAMEARGYALWLFALAAALYAMTRWTERLALPWAVAWGLAN